MIDPIDLPHRADVEEYALVQLPNGELSQTWTVKHYDVPCRLYTQVETKPLDTLGGVMVTILKVLLDPSFTISHHDRLVNIRDLDYETVEAGPLRIEQVIPRRDETGELFFNTLHVQVND